jgi:hypothetical protein
VAYIEDHDLEPHDTLIAFERWYLMKTRLPVNRSDLKVVLWLADDIETGEANFAENCRS